MSIVADPNTIARAIVSSGRYAAIGEHEKAFKERTNPYMLAMGEATPKYADSIVYDAQQSISFSAMASSKNGVSIMASAVAKVYAGVTDQILKALTTRSSLYIRSDFQYLIDNDPSSMTFRVVGWMDAVIIPDDEEDALLFQELSLKDAMATSSNSSFQTVMVMGVQDDTVVIKDTKDSSKRKHISLQELYKLYKRI